MSAANIAFVQSLYAAFGRGDIATIINGLAADVDWSANGRRKDYPLFGSWKGQAEVQKFFQGVAEHGEAVEFSPKEFFGSEDRVCVLGHYAWTIRKTGRQVASDWVHIFTVHNDKVVKFREFNDTAQFAEAYRG
jgi:ketosteroid isomerase-like protein